MENLIAHGLVQKIEFQDNNLEYIKKTIRNYFPITNQVDWVYLKPEGTDKLVPIITNQTINGEFIKK